MANTFGNLIYRLRPMSFAAAAMAVGLFCLTGCDCLHSTQYHICSATGYYSENPELRAREVLPVLRAAATQLGLEERNWPLQVNGAFCIFSEPTNNLPNAGRALWFGARTSHYLVVVDTSLWNPGCNSERTRLFEQAEKVLESRLQNAFPQCVVRVDDNRVRIPMEPIQRKP